MDFRNVHGHNCHQPTAFVREQVTFHVALRMVLLLKQDLAREALSHRRVLLELGALEWATPSRVLCIHVQKFVDRKDVRRKSSVGVQNCDNPICRVRLVAKNGVTACARVAVVVTACAAVAVVARSSGLVSCAPWVSRSQCGRMLISTDLGHGNVVVVIVVTWTDPGLRPFLHGRRSRLTARLDLAKTDEVSSFREMHVLFTYCAERGAPPLRSWCERFPLRSTSSKSCRAPVLRP